jgi:hypothetical protein
MHAANDARHGYSITSSPEQGHQQIAGVESKDWPSRNPITGIADCCARAASGHATAPPSVAKNFRRSM